ncbi:MAG: hypothetical protein WAW36_03145 [Methylovulum miyakonense]|uniref:hypothetical protein n=1 Tax=Methylovulum miyakonense TaxID=645578 RepID=UPI003BB72992
MHLLSAINNNVNEWHDTLNFTEEKPRLPLPYVLGGSFKLAGHELSALDMRSGASKSETFPFKSIYYSDELTAALENVDVAILSGSFALKALLKQSLYIRMQKKILYFTYVMTPKNVSWKQRIEEVAIKLLANSARGVVVMTTEQESLARKLLGNAAPVIKLNCGIDTSFYRVQSSLSDVPEQYKCIVDELLNYPYVVMPGDQLRCNDDVLRFVENTGIRLVRITQSGTKLLKQKILDRGLGDRIFVFEKISYPFVRFILQHALAYAGLVDSSWQPAGWTVACETLASGLPMVVYEGLVSRELQTLQIPSELMRVVPLNDVDEFSKQMLEILYLKETSLFTKQSMDFAAQCLDFSITAPDFVKQVEAISER